jgi:hypothetical protein
VVCEEEAGARRPVAGAYALLGAGVGFRLGPRDPRSGDTTSTKFPLVDPIDAVGGGTLRDAFVTKMTPSGALVYSTYLGGGGSDETEVGGEAFVARLAASGAALEYSTYLGGSGATAARRSRWTPPASRTSPA